MKMNKWTMALAAAGVVSLSSVAQAQEAAAGANALAASTTLSGYVSTSYTLSQGGNDATQLDVVDIKLASAQGAGEYATGYTVELWAGPGANSGTLGTSTNDDTLAVYQANIDLRVPLGNGLGIKVGQFTTVVGAETPNPNENVFHTRSRAFDNQQPTHHTGFLMSYQINDDASVALGLVNDTQSNITNADGGGSGTAYLVSLDYTFPDSMGFLGGTELTYAAVLNAGADAAERDNQYIGLTIPLPVEGLSYSASWDNVETDGTGKDTTLMSHYLSYAATDKITLNLRYETGNINAAGNLGTALAPADPNVDGVSDISVGVDYQLWENVISRVEYIEHSDDGNGSTLGSKEGAESLVFNIIYSF